MVIMLKTHWQFTLSAEIHKKAWKTFSLNRYKHAEILVLISFILKRNQSKSCRMFVAFQMNAVYSQSLSQKKHH